MLEIKKETEEYSLYSVDSLKYITDKMYDIFEKSISRYKKLFNIKKFRKIQINFFDDINDFREYIYALRGEKESLPSYAKGTFDNGMINAFIENDLIVDSPIYIRKLYLASHELFHIMYQELVCNKYKKRRVVWFDEGMAQFFSGEYDYELSDKYFENWFKTLVKDTKIIPNLNDLDHGVEFETSNYSGYKLSLLAVKYLYDTMTFDSFKVLMYNPNDIIENGSKVLTDAFKYYNNKYDKS